MAGLPLLVLVLLVIRRRRRKARQRRGASAVADALGRRPVSFPAGIYNNFRGPKEWR